MKDISLGEHFLKDGLRIYDVKGSLMPKNEKYDDFNFQLSLDEDKFLGIESQELKFKGKGEIRIGTGESQTK